MKIRFFLIPFILFAILQSCLGSGDSIHQFEYLVNSVTKNSAKKVEKEMPILELYGMGGSMKDDVIIFETIVFTVKKVINKDEGIEIISKIIEIYLREIYSDKRMEDYLKEHPFTYKNLNIKLFVSDENYNDVYHPSIGFFRLRDGMISYETIVRNEEGYSKKESYSEEPFETAAKRVGVWHSYFNNPEISEHVTEK